MAVHDFKSQRMLVDHDLSDGARITLSSDQANYLVNVLRMRAGQQVLVFNGRDGEWQAGLEEAGRKAYRLVIEQQVRPQAGGPDIDYLFAPLKRARLDYMVQKAVELGVARLRPVLTRHTQVDRVNLERMRANVTEAAEQCGVLRVPAIEAPERLDTVLRDWPASRALIFCDEAAALQDPIAALGAVPAGPLAVIVGPEGGFSDDERAQLRSMANSHVVSLGPRIMRADTAAVAVLALVNACLGDWRGPADRAAK